MTGTPAGGSVRARMHTETLGERIRKVRLKARITLRGFAALAEVSPSFLCDVEAGRRYPTDDVLDRFARELKVEAADLRVLDNRAYLTELKRLLDSDPVWGLVFKEIAEAGRAGTLSPKDVLGRLKVGI